MESSISHHPLSLSPRIMEGTSSPPGPADPALAQRPWRSEAEEMRGKYTMPYCPHVCKVCGKRFSTKQALGGHQNGHNQERRFRSEYNTRHAAIAPPISATRISNKIHFASPPLGRVIFPRLNIPRRFDDPPPPLEALKNGGSQVPTVNFLDTNCSSFPGPITIPAYDCMDEEYDKAKLAGLDLTLHL